MVAANSYSPNTNSSEFPSLPSGSPERLSNISVLDYARNTAIGLGRTLLEAELIDELQLTAVLRQFTQDRTTDIIEESGFNSNFTAAAISLFASHTPLSQDTIEFFAVGMPLLQHERHVDLLGKLLLRAGLLEEWQVQAILKQQRRQPRRRFGEIAVERGWLQQGTLNYFLNHLSVSARTTLTEIHPSVGCMWKRAVDILGGAVGLVILGALYVPISIAIKLDSDGPVLYSQERCGLRGKPFRLWKFRSMVRDADTRKAELDSDVDGQIFKQASDPRITRVGQFLRRTSLDEFPQFWNILKGDMSLVGTRPPHTG